jgi:hypothetical protein
MIMNSVAADVSLLNLLALVRIDPFCGRELSENATSPHPSPQVGERVASRRVRGNRWPRSFWNCAGNFRVGPHQLLPILK